MAHLIKKKAIFFFKQNFSEPLEPIFHLAGLSKTYGRVGVFTACCMFYEAECFTHVKLSRKFKGEMGSLFDPCVKAMGQRPYWPSHMEVSYCIFRFGANIRCNVRTLSLLRDSLCDNQLTIMRAGFKSTREKQLTRAWQA